MSDSDGGPTPARPRKPLNKKARTTNKSVLQTQRERLANGGKARTGNATQKRPRVKAEGTTGKPDPKRRRVAPNPRQTTRPSKNGTGVAKRSPPNTAGGTKSTRTRKKKNRLDKMKNSFKKEQAKQKAAAMSAKQQRLRPISPARVAPNRTSAPDPSAYSSSASQVRQYLILSYLRTVLFWRLLGRCDSHFLQMCDCKQATCNVYFYNTPCLTVISTNFGCVTYCRRC